MIHEFIIINTLEMCSCIPKPHMKTIACEEDTDTGDSPNN